MQEDIEKSLAILSEGGTILYPTDTIWGIGCDATNEAVVEKIIQLKNRPHHKSFVVLATEKMLLEYVASLDLAVFDYLKTVDKPTTVIYQNAVGLAENVLAENGSVAIRICNEPFCKALLNRFKKPILSTSANLSGEPAPKIFKEINYIIKSTVDYIVNYRQDDENLSEPSAIIKWNNGNIEIIRK